MNKNKTNPNLKLLPFVTALCVLVFTAVGCRHNVVLQELLRNRNKRTVPETIYPDAYYVKHGGIGDGTAYSTPFGMLSQALNAARASGGKTDRVVVIGTLKSVDSGLTGGGVFPLENYGTSENPITISGMTGGTLDGNNSNTVMSITNCHLRFENITFTNGKGWYGGGLYIDGNSEVTLLNGARITGNTASNGGGVSVKDSTLTIDGAEISNNKATVNDATGTCYQGGGLYAGSNADVIVKSGLFTVNNATSRGGGIYVEGDIDDYGTVIPGCKSFTMEDGRISANTAGSQGGGIWTNSSGKVEINGGAINRNTARNTNTGNTMTLPPQAGGGTITYYYEYGGGGIYIGYSTVSFTLKNAVIDSNSAGLDGGGILSYAGSNWEVDGATITNNTAGQYGGGVFVSRGTMTYTSGKISGNTADNTGNSIYCRNYASDSLNRQGNLEQYKGYVTGGITMSFGDFRDDDINIP